MAFHQENFDNQLGLHLASEGGMGLADALYRQLLRHYQPDTAASERPGASGTGAGATGNAATGTEITASSADNVRQTAAAAYRATGNVMASQPQVMTHE